MMVYHKRILVVEDSYDSLEAMADIFIGGILGEPLTAQPHDDPAEALRQRGVDVATTYTEAETYINTNDYDIVFLDHNLPEAKNRLSQNIGYGLIPIIRDRNAHTLIVGTSSMPAQELSKFDSPDHQESKAVFSIEKKLREILEELEH
jgi:CheY-like chemotaxis protein